MNYSSIIVFPIVNHRIMNSFPIEFSSRLSSDTFRHRAPRHCQRTVTIAMFSDGFSRRLFIESMSQSCTPCRRHPFDCQRLIMKRHAHDLQSKTHSRLEKNSSLPIQTFNPNATIGAKFLLQLFSLQKEMPVFSCIHRFPQSRLQ